MPETTGKVRCIAASDDAGFTTLNLTGGGTETFILWLAPGPGGIPRNLTSFTRILHSMWISFLRDAQANNLTVTIVHGQNSAEVGSVRMGVF
jgi:hypothetical protein